VEVLRAGRGTAERHFTGGKVMKGREKTSIAATSGEKNQGVEKISKGRQEIEAHVANP